MTDLLTEALPALIGAALSPLGLLMAVAMLPGRGGVARTLGLLAGAALPRAAFAAVAIFFGSLLASSSKIFSWVELILGAALLILGLRALAKRLTGRAGDAQPSDQDTHAGASPRQALVIGIGFMLGNVSTEILFLSAMKDVAASKIGLDERLLVAAAAIVITLTTIWLPLVFTIALPKTAARMLDGVSAFMQRHHQSIFIVLVLAFGVYMVAEGASAL